MKMGCNGTPSTLVSSTNRLVNVLYDSTTNNLFLVEDIAGAVDRYTTAGGLIARTTNMQPFSVTLDSNYVYMGFANGIMRSTKDFATSSVIANAAGVPATILAVDPSDTTIYGMGGPLISASTSSSGAWSTFVAASSVTSYGAALLVTNNTVYWTNRGTQANNYTDGGLYMCSAVGCTQPILAIPNTMPEGASLVADANNLYFFINHHLYRCAIGQCSATMTQLESAQYYVQPGPPGPTLAQDATSLYWVDLSGVVSRLAK
jgi:hypothetical protein